MNLFSLREEEIFKTLKDLRDCNLVIIGGYAVNAYTLPRFSVDCDIVLKDAKELRKIDKILLSRGYKPKVAFEDAPYSGSFSRYEKKLENEFMVSMDILIQSVVDRMTAVCFSAAWIFQNSERKTLRGKTIGEELKLKIINLDALIVMKTISCRSTDIRDVFMMLPQAKNEEWIKAEISQRYNFQERVSKLMEKVHSAQFKDGLFGVYGKFDQKVFEKHQKAVASLQNR